MLFSIFDILRIFEALQIFFYKFLLKWGKIEEDFESSIFLEAQKYYFAFESRLNFFSSGHIRNVVKIDVENDNVVLTLSNLVQFNVETHNVVSTLLNILNFNVDVHNVFSMLIWRCAMSRRTSLVNMLVAFCGKLEYSFLTAAMLFVYLHFSTTTKVPRPKTWQITKVIINKFFDQQIRKATKKLWRFDLVRF